MSSNIDIYHQVAEGFTSQYNALKPEDVHQSWRNYWPAADALVLDIGAGSGRDALWLAQQSCEVFAVEPAKALRELGQELTAAVCATDPKTKAVHWLDDRLPELKTVLQLGLKFDLILVSAVWMHLTPAEQERSFRKLSNLLKASGRLVISLRHGDFNDGRTAYPVSVHSIDQLCVQQALELSFQQQGTDAMGRENVQWQTVVCTLPDDGSGSLSQVRHINLNSSKSR
jgi:SAM-dependent methyltransferase